MNKERTIRGLKQTLEEHHRTLFYNLIITAKPNEITHTYTHTLYSQ